MTKKNQFWKGILLGAIAGGAISLLDKTTRETMKENVQKAAGKVSYLIQNRGEIVDQVKETTAKLTTTLKQVSEDVSFIVEKVDDLKELTPKVTETIKETKDTIESELLKEKDIH